MLKVLENRKVKTMKQKILSLLRDKNKLSKVLLGMVLMCALVLVTDMSAFATQNAGYGYGYGAGDYAYGYGYFAASGTTVALKYNLCTSSCSVSESTAVTITATFSEAPYEAPDIRIVDGTTTTAFTAMSGSGTTWTYAYTTDAVSADTTVTVSLRTLAGSGYTPTPSNATFTNTNSTGGSGGSGGSAATPSVVVTPVTTTTTTTTTTVVTPAQATVVNTAAEAKATADIAGITKTASAGAVSQAVYFIAYGTDASVKMSANDRKGVIGDYNAIYGRIPTSDKDWSDVNLVLTGKKPTQRALKAEQAGLKDFVKVYKRLPNFKLVGDELTLYYMSYNIRPLGRDLVKEKAAITKFRSVYKIVPKTSHQWSIVRGYAYGNAGK